MSDLVRALGVGPRVFFDGKECFVGPRTLELDALIDAEILKQRGDPFQQVIDAAVGAKLEDGKPNDDLIRALADAGMNAARRHRNVSWSEHMAYSDTLDGKALELWYCLKGNFGPDWTVGRVKYVLAESMRLAFDSGDRRLQEAWREWRDGLTKAIEIAGGEDLLGNLTGLRRTIAPNHPADTGGGQSSDASAKDQTEKS